MSDDNSNMEILSKIVIQLKQELKDSVKTLKSEISELKLNKESKNNTSNSKEIDELKSEIINLNKKNCENEEKFQERLQIYESRYEKLDKELREDMLKLLKKYENKFETQDNEIENLKEKCEMGNCSNCGVENFRINLKDCEFCFTSICVDCLKNCKKCDTMKCTKCLFECKCCKELICEKENCAKNCEICTEKFCDLCKESCLKCNKTFDKFCTIKCRICELNVCFNCCKKCENCDDAVICETCFQKNPKNENCICGKFLCFNCEDQCESCKIPFTFLDNNRIFQGFHTKSKDFLPNKCLIKLVILQKGIDTTHIGLTIDDLKIEEKATENFWSLCLNTGEKFSTMDYKKKGSPWGNYANSALVKDDVIYIKYNEGDLRFLVNRKDYGRAFILDRHLKYYLYCLTHNDSSKIEIRWIKILKN